MGIARCNGDRGSIRTKVNKAGIVLVCCDGCSIAQLSGVVATPTHERTVVENGTGMVRSDVEGHRRSACAEINGRGRGRGAVGHPCAIAEFSIGVLTPALHGTVVKKCARVRVVYGDRLRRAAGSKADGHRRMLVRRGSVTDLPIAVLSPALEGAVVEDGTTEVVAVRHRLSGQSGPEVHPTWGMEVRVA